MLFTTGGVFNRFSAIVMFNSFIMLELYMAEYIGINNAHICRLDAGLIRFIAEINWIKLIIVQIPPTPQKKNPHAEAGAILGNGGDGFLVDILETPTGWDGCEWKVGGDGGIFWFGKGTAMPGIFEIGAHCAAPSYQAISFGVNAPDSSFWRISSKVNGPDCWLFWWIRIFMVVDGGIFWFAKGTAMPGIVEIGAHCATPSYQAIILEVNSPDSSFWRISSKVNGPDCWLLWWIRIFMVIFSFVYQLH